MGNGGSILKIKYGNILLLILFITSFFTLVVIGIDVYNCKSISLEKYIASIINTICCFLSFGGLITKDDED